MTAPTSATPSRKTVRITLFAAATAILLLAFGLRAAAITISPPGLSGDEGINGSDALNVWRWGQRPIFFTNNYGREAGFIYMMALTMRLFGANVLSIRLPAIASGTAGILLSFVLLRRLWNLRVATVAAVLMSVSFWPIFVSRVGLRAVSMLPLQALAAYSLWRGLTSAPRRSFKWFIVAGVSLGLVTYTYIPGRIFPVVLVGWFLSMWLLTPPGRRPPIARHLPALALTAAIALAIFAPFGLFILQNPDQANQRVQELSGILNSLRDGDVRPLMGATIKTLGMFTFVGDQYWRYNIAYRPVFDWITGAFFYGGVLLSVFRIRRPGNQLLLLWLGAMLMPSILAPGSPSFLRATGAIIPIYALPAIALDATIQWLDRRAWLPARDVSRGAALLTLVGLSAVAIKDGVAYFVTWPNTPRVREVYTAGLAQVGRQLSQLVGEEATVLVGCDFASDYARDMVSFQTAYRGPIRWFTGRSAMVYPAASQTEDDAYFLLADALPPDALLAPVAAGSEPIYQSTSSDGAFESAGYRLPASARDSVPWQPTTPLSGTFQNAMALVGYTAPEEVQRGGSASFLVVWQVPPTFEVDRTEALWFHLELKDAEGNTWDTRANLLPYATWEWKPGDVVAQWLTVPVAAEVPPGQLMLEFAIEKAQAPLPYVAAGNRPADAVAMGPITVVGAPVTELSEDAIRLGDEADIALVDAQIIGVALPGDTVHATLIWQAVAAPREEYAARLQIRAGDCAGTPVYTEILPLWPDRYPTSQWQAGERIRTFHHPELPRDLTVGAYAITIDLISASKGEQDRSAASAQACYPLEITGHRRVFEPPPMDDRLDQPLADGIELVGYRISPPLDEIGPGETMEVTLVWQASGEPMQSYTVFTHLYDATGDLIAQHDGLPCGGNCPTSSWIRDEVITDVHPLTLPTDAESGTYIVGVGMYNSQSLERLDVPDSDQDLITLPGPSVP